MLTTDMLNVTNHIFKTPSQKINPTTPMKSLVSLARSVFLLALLTVLPLTAQAQLTWGSSGTGGSGTWNDVNTNWYNGATDVIWNSGSANFAGTAGTVTVSGTLDATDLRFGTSFYNLNGGTINLTGAPTISGATGITINSVLSSTNGVTVSNGKTFAGNNANLNGVIVANGNGTSAAVLRIGNSNGLGSSSAFADRISLVQGAQGAVLQVDNGVVLNKYIANTGAATVETISGTATLTGNVVPGATLVYTAAANTALILSGSAGLGQSGQSVQATGAGRLIVNAAAGGTAFGFFIRNSATVQVNSGFTIGPGGSNVFFDGGAGTPTLALNGSTVSNNFFFGSTASPIIENMSAGSSTFSGQLLNNGANYSVMLRSTTSGTLNVSGNINDSTFIGTVAIGNGSFANSGVVNLSRASGNTYDGGTTVNNGTLLVNNTSSSATGTGAVTVASGATLGGAGIISGTTTVNGIIAPGNSIGILTVQNDVVWNGGLSASSATDWKFELGASNTADLLSITGGSSDFLKGTGSVFRFDFQGGADLGTFALVDWAGTTDFASTDFSFTNLGGGNTGTFAFNGTQLEFTSVVPEPSTSLLMGLGFAVSLFAFRRRSSVRA